MNEDRIARIAKSITAGGTLFDIKKAPFKYKASVERMMPRWFLSAGDYSGDYVPRSIEWGKMKASDQLMSVYHEFTFEQMVEGEIIEEQGKVEARFYGSELVIRVMLYS